MKEQSWKEFRETGLLWFVNGILHLFGWSIVMMVNKKTGKVKDVYPVRTKFRGFSEETNEKGYVSVTNYLKENIDDLIKEVNNE